MTRSRDVLASVEQFAIAEEIASLVRHDLRNRLAAIRNSSYFLERRVKTTALWNEEPRLPKFFGLITDEVVAADALVQEKLAIAQLRGRNVVSASVMGCIDLAASAVRGPAEIEIAAPEAEVRVAADIEELAVAIRALLENAVESNEGAHARVEVSVDGARVRIAIVDKGPGMTEAHYSKAMQPLFTTKPGRLGLGSNLADRIVRRHSGALTNEPDEQGARVVVELPIEAAG